MSRLAAMLAGALLLAVPGSVGAQVLQLDVRWLFNADVILNGGSGTLDPTQDPVDLGSMASNNFCFPTASVALQLWPLSPDGVPDDAVFAATAFHPDVRLWWHDDDDGLNARRNPRSPDSFNLSPPPGNYSEFHVFMTAGDGTADVTVTLGYSTGPEDVVVLFVPDWFDDPIDTADAYRLIDGRDRVQVGSGPGVPFAYEDRDDAAIFGFRLRTDPSREVTDVRLSRTDSRSVLNFFGAIAVQAQDTLLYESLLAPGLLDPANAVASGVTSPLDWTPPPGDLLHYFIDDGAGNPALIFVSKAGGGIRFTF